jgi:hypothetical protein
MIDVQTWYERFNMRIKNIPDKFMLTDNDFLSMHFKPVTLEGKEKKYTYF